MRAWISSLLLLLFFGCSHAEQLDLSRLKVPAFTSAFLPKRRARDY